MGTVHKFQGAGGPYRWDDVTVAQYEDGPVAGVTRQILIGPKEGSKNFIVRYFELPPGTASAYHTHDHEHGVVVLRGRGRVRIGEREQDLSFGDVVYVPPDEIHQFSNAGDEPFGFTCTIKGR
jgi:quercetin dioxygenase-like cupin family protein